MEIDIGVNRFLKGEPQALRPSLDPYSGSREGRDDLSRSSREVTPDSTDRVKMSVETLTSAVTHHILAQFQIVHLLIEQF